MANTNRRHILRAGLAFVGFPFTTILNLRCKSNQESATPATEHLPEDPQNMNDNDTYQGDAMQVHYLEIVTNDVETVCTLYSNMHGVTFGDSDENLGGARTARLASGATLGVRAPMHDAEKPVVRPYILVKDIEATVEAAADSGAEIAVSPMEIPGRGKCAIVIQGGIESGLWQL